MGNRTFAMIKPDAINNGYSGKILDRIINAKFKILGIKMIRMTKKQAQGFYSIHSEKPFFEDLTSFMSSGKTLVLALEKENAVEEWRNLMGATDSQKAEIGTIRNKYGTDVSMNATHGSDSNKNATREINFFFND